MLEATTTQPSAKCLEMFYMGGSIYSGSPRYGWFVVENSSINGWFGDTPILGNLHICINHYQLSSTRIYWGSWPACPAHFFARWDRVRSCLKWIHQRQWRSTQRSDIIQLLGPVKVKQEINKGGPCEIPIYREWLLPMQMFKSVNLQIYISCIPL